MVLTAGAVCDVEAVSVLVLLHSCGEHFGGGDKTAFASEVVATAVHWRVRSVAADVFWGRRFAEPMFCGGMSPDGEAIGSNPTKDVLSVPVRLPPHECTATSAETAATTQTAPAVKSIGLPLHPRTSRGVPPHPRTSPRCTAAPEDIPAVYRCSRGHPAVYRRTRGHPRGLPLLSRTSPRNFMRRALRGW